MPDNGVRTIDLTNLASAEDLLAHDSGTLGMLPLASLSTRLAASGALAEAIAGRASTEQTDALAAEIDVLRANQTSGLVTAATWTELLGLAPALDATGGEVLDSDTGTHAQATGTGYDGASVPNAGRYRWSLGAGRWVWLGPSGLSGKADADAVVALTGDQTVGGIKTFSTAPVVPDGAFPLAKVTGAASATALAAVAAPVAEISRGSHNLFDPATAVMNRVVNRNTGALDVSSGYFTSDFIPVSPGDTLLVPRPLLYIVWFDAAQHYLGNMGETASRSAVAPEGAAFGRTSGQVIGQYTLENYYVQRSATPLPFEAPGQKLRGAQVVDLPGAALLDGAVTPAKTSFWTRGKNLFNTSTRTVGAYIGTNGTQMASATYSVSAPIPVVPGETYICSGGSYRFVTFYDAAGTPMEAESIGTSGTTFTAPAGAAYARVTLTETQQAAFQIELGTVASSYQAFGYDAAQLAADGGVLRWPAGEAEIARPAHFGAERLRESHRRLTMMEAGLLGTSSRLVIALIGDSWTHRGAARWAGKFAAKLWAEFPHATASDPDSAPIGRGWLGFGGLTSNINGDILDNARVTASGAWTDLYRETNSPDISGLRGSTGATLTWSVEYAATPARAYRLFFEGGVGVIRYRWTDAGAWTEIDLTSFASGTRWEDLAGAPSTGSGTFTLEVVSGAPELFGWTEASPDSEGVLVHKLGATGSLTAHWTARNATQWQAGLAQLAPDLVVMMFGTNDQSSPKTKAQFKADTLAMIDRIRAARPTADILLVAPAENNRTDNAIAMAEYAEAYYEIARDLRDVAYLDLQPAFGATPQDYAFGSARPLMNLDGIHPNDTTGSYTILMEIWAMVTRGVI